jgi:ribosomal protein S13
MCYVFLGRRVAHNLRLNSVFRRFSNLGALSTMNWVSAAVGISPYSNFWFLKKSVIVQRVIRFYFLYGRQYKIRIFKYVLDQDKIRLYNALRRRQCLPVRGQRTHSNRYTARKLFFIFFKQRKRGIL